ncbi:MAG TPA: sulfotransferase [Acetobacteraceae bacterium]|nr:sulfotransferase [Acetobacteraceae bacterium]
MESLPLFILGAPRSGTTFLTHVLNQHPAVDITSESRIFVLLKDLVEERSERGDLLDASIRDRFQSFLRAEAGRFVERFYREGLGFTAPIWGDKHTSYADPAVLSGRHRGVMAEPRSGSCLALIRETLPRARFIHIHRHPWQVASSLCRRGWVGSIAEGVQVWRQHVGEAVAFLDELDPGESLSLSLYELVDAPEAAAEAIARLLGLSDAEPFAHVLRAEQAKPTPFSSPTSDLAGLRSGHTRAVEEAGRGLQAGAAAVRLGYC